MTWRCKRHEFDPWLEKIPWRRKWPLTQVSEVLVRTQMELFNKQLKSGSGAQEGVSAEVQVRMVDTEKGCELSLGKPEA